MQFLSYLLIGSRALKETVEQGLYIKCGSTDCDDGLITALYLLNCRVSQIEKSPHAEGFARLDYVN